MSINKKHFLTVSVMLLFLSSGSVMHTVMQGVEAANVARATFVYSLIESTNIYGTHIKLYAKTWEFQVWGPCG